MKQKCEEMYPWICNYSRGVHEDVGVLSWLFGNGQNCPNCAVGVERIKWMLSHDVSDVCHSLLL